MKTITTRQLVLAMVALLILVNTGCRKDEESFMSEEVITGNSTDLVRCVQPEKSEIIKPWYKLLTNLIQTTPGHTPPIAAREIGYTGIALYEASTSGFHGWKTLAGQLNGLNSLPSRPPGNYIGSVAGNAAMARIIKKLIGNASAAGKNSIDSLEAAYEAIYSSQYPAADFNVSKDFGHQIGDAIFAWSQTDNADQAYLNIFPSTYTPPSGAGMWVPTPPAYSAAMLPYWGNTRTFVPSNNPGPVDPPPLAFPYSTATNSNMYKAANIVYTTVNNLTQAQKDIADYWNDGAGTFTPPGHNISIVVQLALSKGLTLENSAALLAKSGMALNDAGIVCWRGKFTNNLLRPITYIRDNIDPAWNSYITTPPFPSYASGHSTFTSATAKVLSRQFGGNTAFTDSTKLPAMSPRYYTSFTQAAREAAASRLYGGIHYEIDNTIGYNCGVMVANNVLAINWK